MAALPSHGRILEIGPGTGQATLPLARAGYEIVAVELGAGLARVARRNLQADQFWTEVQEDYDAVDPSDLSKPPPMLDDVQGIISEIEGSGYFESLGSRHYSWNVVYTAGEYIAVLDT